MRYCLETRGPQTIQKYDRQTWPYVKGWERPAFSLPSRESVDAKYNLIFQMSEELSLRDVRLQKLARMRELGHDPFLMERFDRTHSAKEMLEGFQEEKHISFAGRVVSYRLMGKAGFAHLSDGDGKVQGYFRKDDLGEIGWRSCTTYSIWATMSASPEHCSSRKLAKSRSTFSLCCRSASASRPSLLARRKTDTSSPDLPISDVRYRHRHLDLICNPDARKALIQRMKMTAAVRRFMDARGYLEVETPMLQLEAGGAAARPFLTHYNAYELDVKLRISLELYLKRIICGDIPKVYEIGRVFRNEGVSNRHSPEFTMFEFYEAYSNLEDIMELVEDLFTHVANEVFGSTQVSISSDPNEEITQHESSETGVVLSFDKPWRRLDLLTAIEDLAGVKREELSRS